MNTIEEMSKDFEERAEKVAKIKACLDLDMFDTLVFMATNRDDVPDQGIGDWIESVVYGEYIKSLGLCEEVKMNIATTSLKAQAPK